MLQWTNPKVQIDFKFDQYGNFSGFEPKGTVNLDLESVESLLARIRPLQLETESIYIPTVMKAVGALLNDAGFDWMANQIATNRKSIQKTLEGDTKNLEIETASMGRVSYRELEKSFFYEDTAHFDIKKNRSLIRETDFETRFSVGAARTMRVAVMTLSLKDWLESNLNEHWLLKEELDYINHQPFSSNELKGVAMFEFFPTFSADEEYWAIKPNLDLALKKIESLNVKRPGVYGGTIQTPQSIRAFKLYLS